MGELSIYNLHMYLYYNIYICYIGEIFEQAICDAIHVLFVKNPHG
jgi:hypothetical protein